MKRTLLLSLLLLISTASAQFVLSPVVRSTPLESGQASVILTVSNTSAEPNRFRVEAEPFTYSDQGFVATEGGVTDATPYIQFAPREFELEPGSSQRVRVVARIPSSAGAQEYRSAVSVSQLATIEATEGEQVFGIVPSLVSTLYFTTPAATPDVEAVDARVVDAQVQLQVRNAGTGSARVAIDYRVTQGDTTLFADTTAQITSIAETTRYMPLAEGVGLEPGTYTLSGTLTPYVGFDAVATVPFELPLVISEP